tara:strand:- start:6 stop:713 length:708 start_codon:yes stop_codon:yes gene_type:complete
MKLNNKLTKLIKYYSLINHNYIFKNAPINRFINKDKNGLSLDKSLNILRKEISLIKNCELKKNANNLVFADGNPGAKVMIIGEGPGANEDKVGKPFVGRAGQLLDKMLNSINLDRTSVYITNVVNYRPPENRKPTEVEIERYLPFLIKHILIIKPKIIMLLGSTALSALIGENEVISKARGKWHDKVFENTRISIMPSFHPAFLMRQPEQKKLAWIDLKMIRDKIKKLGIKIEKS